MKYLKSTDQIDADVLVRESRAVSIAVFASIGIIAFLAIYLLQRALTGLAYSAPHVLAWSDQWQVRVLGLRFSYITMTIVWPIVLAAVCFVCTVAVSKKLLLLKECNGRSRWSIDNLLGRELADRFAKYVWSVLSLLPTIIIGIHFLNGAASLVLLFQSRPRTLDSFYWPVEHMIVAATMLILTCTLGLISGKRFFSSIRALRMGLVECSQLAGQQPVTSPLRASTATTSSEFGQSMTDWEIFISAKKLASDGSISRDSVVAEELYEFLESKGHCVFLSSRSLETMGTSSYKIAIDQALDQCKVLIAVGTSTENLDSGWVKYEWDSFLNDILSGFKPDGRLFVYVEGVGISELPRPLRQSQVFEHGSGNMQRLATFIQNAPDETT